ncbi:MAG: glycine C-acetyltransferase [Candidatus Thermoplasmatota archaeon]|nr:glycine C-acetyltransferase [Candidatus Thermoplasmatota archaeon]
MGKMDFLKEELNRLKAEGRYVNIRALNTPQGAWVEIGGKRVLNLCSNNYLGLANDERLKKAAEETIDRYGVGAGAVRTIAGTMDIHEEFERRIARFKNCKSAILFQSGFNANLGSISAIADAGDAIISEELNHASLIDGCRLSKAKRYVYKHLDMQSLESTIKEALKEKPRRILIATDGVFSMDGDIAPMDEIGEIAEKYGCIVYVDDAHGEGVLGDHGRGIVDHFNAYGKVNVEMGTLSKAFGVMGGYVAGDEDLAEYLKQKARPFLFSSALNPGDVAAALESVKILEESDSLVKKLWSNTEYLKQKLRDLGFNLGTSKTPITPVMVGEEVKATELSKTLFEEENIFAQAIVYPTVPRGKARIRLQPSAIHSKEDLDYAINSIERVGKKLKLI